MPDDAVCTLSPDRMRRGPLPVLSAVLGSACLFLAACGDSAPQSPVPPPRVSLTPKEKEVWAPAPPDHTTIPVLLYHGIGDESDFANPDDAAFGVNPEDFAKQMTLLKHAGYQTISL